MGPLTGPKQTRDDAEDAAISPGRSIVVTGGTGYVGRPLIEQLIARGHDVTALARPQSRARVPSGARTSMARRSRQTIWFVR